MIPQLFALETDSKNSCPDDDATTGLCGILKGRLTGSKFINTKRRNELVAMACG